MADVQLALSLGSALQRESASAAQRFARWEGAVFAEWSHGPVASVWALDPARGLDLLRLVVEGVGRGMLGSLEARPKTWLDGLLRGPALSWLAETPTAERAALLVRIWNLGEGAHRESAWMDRYLLARLSAKGSHWQPATLLDEVSRELEPLLGEVVPPSWRGPYQVSLLNLRATDDRFLPGKMAMMGPRLLAVQDRRRDAVLGVLLGPGPPSVLGPLDALDETPPEGELPGVRWEGALFIGEQRVALPTLHEPLELAVAAAGYVVASGVDSQRLWVVAHA